MEHSQDCYKSMGKGGSNFPQAGLYYYHSNSEGGQVMQVRIAICDADVGIQSVVRGAVEAVLRENGLDPVFDGFQSGKTLLQSAAQTPYDLVLLEVDLPELDGIALGQALRRQVPQTRIIYVSSWEDRVFEALGARPLAFVRKRAFFQDLLPAVDLFLEVFRQGRGNTLRFETRRGNVELDLDRVCYIEGSRNYQLVYLAGEPAPLEVKMTMDRLEEATASRGFLRTHRGYLVNPRYVERMTYDQVFLSGGSWLPVGQSKARLVRRQFQTMQRA